MEKIVFFIGLILATGGLLSPPLALASVEISPAGVSGGSGFGMNLAEVVKVGRSGFVYTITGAMLLGLAIGRWLRVERPSSVEEARSPNLFASTSQAGRQSLVAVKG
jgi:hypothetical protein